MLVLSWVGVCVAGPPGEVRGFYVTTLMRKNRKAWVRGLSSDARINLDGEAVARKLYTSHVQNEGPKVRAPRLPYSRLLKF